MRLFLVIILAFALSGCGYQMNELEFQTLPEPSIDSELDIGVTDSNYGNKCTFDGDFGLSGYSYMEVSTVVDGSERNIIIDVANKTITYDGVTHDYLRNKSFINGLEVDKAVSIPDWPVMDFKSVADAWNLLISDYPLEIGSVGEYIDGYEYYTKERPTPENALTGAIPDRLGTEEYTYIFKGNQVVSLAIDTSYFVEDIEYHTQLSMQILSVK